jgi:Domain of unknown function (DUF4178)
MASTPQRAYTAACPGCGAAVAFRSAQSTHAVCGYCQSTVVRDGDTLARLGKMAEIFDDYSPLQLFASGRWPNLNAPATSTGFTAIGRLQYKTASGTWSEWQLAMDDASTAVLSEDNGAFVFSTALPSQRDIPDPEDFRLGATTAFNGKTYTITANESAALMAAQGELPKLPELGRSFAVIELRSDDGEVLSVDYSTQPPSLSSGRAVLLDHLQLVGLRDTVTKASKGQQFSCPNCGSPITVSLATSKSITCNSCHSIVDVSQGIGGALTHALQDEPVQLLIPLGTSGKLQGVDWQVVGFQHRMGVEAGDDEHFGWSEYLLYNQKRGFCFLVDAEDGWSVVQPTTGAPSVTGNGRSATYLGMRYELKSGYLSETTYVAGEFYWPVVRGQKTSNRDYANVNAKNLLSMEQTATELTWSSGAQIDSASVVTAFGLADKAELLKRLDKTPVSALSAKGCLTLFLICGVLILVLFLLSRCTACDPNVQDCGTNYTSTGTGSRSSGGSFGGFSGGGGHK